MTDEEIELEKAYDKIIAEYRAYFLFLTDDQYDSLVMTAGQNQGDVESEMLGYFGASLEAFTHYPRSEILEIV